MGLESTVICIDNSEYCRNGDFPPTRLQQQFETVGVITRARQRTNAENSCGVLTMSNNQMLMTLTSDQNKLASIGNRIKAEGDCRFIQAVRVAQLALKHRMNKHHRQRIIVFCCSPIDDEDKELIKIAKRLKKEKVNMDIVTFGEDEVNQAKLSQFIETINGKDGGNCHLVRITAGTNLADAVRQSAIVDDGSGAGGGAGGGADAMEDMDPELAMALRISLEEQRARTQQAPGGEANQTSDETSQPMDQDQQMLQQALAMSVGGGAANSDAVSESPAQAVDLGAMTEEEQIAYALQMSMADQNPEPMEEEVPAADDSAQLVTDPAFLQEVLRSLPDVDINSDAVRQALGQPPKDKDDSGEKDEKK